MSRMLPPDTEDMEYVDETDDINESSYNEAMSRAAVGRLFANDDAP